MTLSRHASFLAFHLFLAACGVHGSGGTSAEQPAPAVTTLRIERAERSLETGRDVAQARESLRAALADPSLSGPDRDRAFLADSRAAELAGDHEGAIRRVEELMAAHEGDHQWAQAGAAEKALRKLLTGTDAVTSSLRGRDRRPVAPVAHALEAFFPPGPDGDVEINVVHYGSGGDSMRLGTYNVGGAITETRRAACPLCEEVGRTRTLESGEASWTAIPKTVTSSRKALEIFYFDLGEGRIPARYDARLPLPSADVVARLERGEGVIAVKLRDGAPPVILIGAPRSAQLGDVEEVFAKMTTLPTEPKAVPIAMELKPEEIQGEVRAAFGSFRACYEELLTRNPAAQGTSNVAFAIVADGSAADVALDGASTLRDPTFDACMIAGFKALHFPKTVRRTTVKYPVSFSP